MELDIFKPERLADKLKGRRLEEADENELFYDGDHLQEAKDFKGYIGILPPKGADEWRSTTEWLKKIFSASNQVKAVVNRHVDGLLGREPDWTIVHLDSERVANESQKDQEDEESRVVQEANDALVEWWNERRLTETLLKPAVRKGLLEQKAVVRAFVPRGFVSDDGSIERVADLREALDRIYFEVLDAGQAGVFVDEAKRELYSVYERPKNDGAKNTASVVVTQTEEEQQQDTSGEVELSFVNDDGLTELHIFDDEGAEKDSTEPLDLNKLLFVYEFEVDLMITEPVRSLQRSINYAITTMNKNLNVAGSRDTYITNAQSPRRKIEKRDAQGKVLGVTYEDAPLEKGGSRANFLAGLPQFDKDGNVSGYSNAGVTTVDPVAVDTFIKARDTYRRDLLEEVHQSHVSINDDATPSGKSRQEARAEFKKSLDDTKGATDSLGRHIVSFALAFASLLRGKPNAFKNYRIDFNCQVFAGEESVEEAKQRKEDLKDGLISLETFLVRSGIEDPDAEIDRLQKDERYKLTMLLRRLEVVNEGLDILPNTRIVEILEPDDETRREELLKAMSEDTPGDRGEQFGKWVLDTETGLAVDPVTREPLDPQPDDLTQPPVPLIA